jgi:hypothetical protein
VVCPGNFTDVFKLPPEFSQLDIANLILQKFLVLGKPLLCVPGNHDPPEILDLLEDYKSNLHSRLRQVKGLDFIGFGGAKTPFNTPFEPSEEEIKESLEALQPKKPFVLVVHNPPKNTGLDKITTGEHVGSETIRKFILNRGPALVITAHIHEAAGIEKLGTSALFNPGPAFQGKYGIAEIGKNTVKCTMLKI